MPSNIYPLGLEKIMEQGIDAMEAAGSGLKIALMSSDGTDYVYDSTHEFFDNLAGDSTDPSQCETAAEDYVQKAAVVTVGLNAGSTRIEIIIADITWDLLGGSPNETITGAILFHDTAGAATTDPLLGYFDVSNITTTNQDFKLIFQPTGNIRMPYTIA